MSINDIRQQAIGKHLYINGNDWGTITRIKNSIFCGKIRVTNEEQQVILLNHNNLPRLLQGEKVRQTRTLNGYACREFGADIYQIPETLKTT